MPTPASRPPNLLFIMADQLGASFLGCYGSGVPSTPTLDALAARGMRFDRAYAASPVCGPNRACILTGRTPVCHGVTMNNLEFAGDMPTYPQVLSRAGYRVGGFGKFHHSDMGQPLPRDFAHLGFHESIPSEDPKTGAWLEWVEKVAPEHYEKALAMSWPMPYTERDRPAWKAAYDKHLEPRRKESPWHLMYPSPLPNEFHQTAYITDCSLDFLERHHREHPGQPFVCFTSFVDPHDPYDPPAPYDTLFRPEDMPEPIPAAWEEKGNPVLKASQQFNGWDEVCHDLATIQKLRALFHGSLRFIDDQVARLLAWLRERGLEENTIVVFTTDHGEMLGDHALITKGVKFFDTGIRVPLLVAGPGVKAGKCDDLVSSLDLFPTFCDWAGATIRPPLEGLSFAPLCAGSAQPEPWPEVTVETPHYMKQLPGTKTEASARAIVTRDGWRFTLFDEDGLGEMYNLREDPREQRNLFDEPAWVEKKLHLYERLTRAYLRSAQVQQWRNLPKRNGRRGYSHGAWTSPDIPVFE